MTNSKTYQYQLSKDSFGMRLAARLSDSSDDLPYEISERLRATREQAVGRRKAVALKAMPRASQLGHAVTATMGSEETSWWDKIASTAPLLILIFGLIAVNLIQDDTHAKEIAEIDSALLTDDLPPSAYADPGFVQYLKMSSGQYK
jgi:hypothetical protein